MPSSSNIPSSLPSLLTEQDLINETNYQLQHGGITFCVRYIGNVSISVSMNSVSPQEQNAVGRACTQKLLHETNQLSIVPNLTAYAEYFTGDPPELPNTDVDMNIASNSIMLIENGISIMQKFMIHDTSLVVPGDQDLFKYFTVFAHIMNKAGEMSRRCFVFYAEHENRVILKTIRAAFRLRKQELSTAPEAKPTPKIRSYSRDKTPTPPSVMTPSGSSSRSVDQPIYQLHPSPPDSVSQLIPLLSDSSSLGEHPSRNRTSSRSPSRSPLSSGSSSKSIIYNLSKDSQEDLSPLIRMDSTSPNTAPPLPPRPRNHSSMAPSIEVPNRNDQTRRSMPMTRPSSGRRSKSNETLGISPRERSQSMAVNISDQQFGAITKHLSHEPWFHGKLSRATAESYIVENGQFLVRQSPNIHGQVVLSGMQDGIVKHICLVGQEGFLRTNDGEFATISQLIKYYFQQRRPVASESSELTLVEPVYRRGIRHVR